MAGVKQVRQSVRRRNSTNTGQLTTQPSWVQTGFMNSRFHSAFRKQTILLHSGGVSNETFLENACHVSSRQRFSNDQISCQRAPSKTQTRKINVRQPTEARPRMLRHRHKIGYPSRFCNDQSPPKKPFDAKSPPHEPHLENTAEIPPKNFHLPDFAPDYTTLSHRRLN